MPHTVYLALGTNVGDRVENLHCALSSLQPAVLIEVCSAIYETPPWGYTDQPVFYNQVIRGVTLLSPLELLDHIKVLEEQLGRQPSFKNGPRRIDIDILFYDDLILETPRLTIPHPRIAGRAFVWVPLAEIAPQLIHPLTGKTAKEHLDELDSSGIIPISEE